MVDVDKYASIQYLKKQLCPLIELNLVDEENKLVNLYV